MLFHGVCNSPNFVFTTNQHWLHRIGGRGWKRIDLVPKKVAIWYFVSTFLSKIVAPPVVVPASLCFFHAAKCYTRVQNFSQFFLVPATLEIPHSRFSSLPLIPPPPQPYSPGLQKPLSPYTPCALPKPLAGQWPKLQLKPTYLVNLNCHRAANYFFCCYKKKCLKQDTKFYKLVHNNSRHLSIISVTSKQTNKQSINQSPGKAPFSLHFLEYFNTRTKYSTFALPKSWQKHWISNQLHVHVLTLAPDLLQGTSATKPNSLSTTFRTSSI